MTPTEGPAWAKGYPLDELRAVADLYREVDAPYVLGAFSRVKENAVAEWLEAGELVAYSAGAPAGWQPGDPAWPVRAAARVSFPRVATPVRDFTGAVRARIEPNSAVIRHPAADAPYWPELLELVQGRAELTSAHRVWLEGWVESPGVQMLVEAAGLELMATKVKASSELVGVWSEPGTPHTLPALEDEVTLARIATLAGLEEAAVAEVQHLAGWADHYSSYNVRHSWSALSLQGYVEPGQAPDPTLILKPSEMAKAWKAEHPGWESWQVAETPLMQGLPGVAGLVGALANVFECEFQRVRLMRLAPGGGELTRHSDITDPEAGTADGKLARIHVPLVTNQSVLFRQWLLDGRQVEAHMEVGTAWYLDTRKPHKAGNYGAAERIHLVLDAYMGPRLRRLLAGGTGAHVVAS